MEKNNITEDIKNEEVQSVGELLHNTRVKQGKTIAEAAEDLCIRKFYLNAIENMDLENIPPAPYGIGFIHSYAQYLGLNSERIVSSYRQNLLQDNSDSNTKHEQQTSEAPKFRHVVLGICGFAALIVAWKMWPQFVPLEDFSSQEDAVIVEPEIVVDNHQEQTDKMTEVQQTTEEKVNNQSAEEATILSAEENETETKKEISATENTNRLKLELTGPSWIELKNGDKVLLSGVYNKGFVYDEELMNGSVISVGRPNNVKVYINKELKKVASSLKKANIALDEFIAENN